ncbi:cbb3-type cytochrome c oxidase subunit 3 [Congregibacter variabilis]|uniref:Cbb3-type cytochrome c oxidase subunit 3 n=1 Tax=Congregibacter variabilis TaxID=3081200 RepID=A0ABZ0I5Y4_9GAMM|nr:cbb3-type cytochrome c oxidase subunit 3 [Congregibacter sp. IMCC43200]
MDINDLRGISTAFLLFAFIGLVIWAYSSKQKKEFDEAANLPFADDTPSQGGNKEGTEQ